MFQSHTDVTQGERDAYPHGQLHPHEQTGLKGVAVVPHVEFGDDPPQILLKMVPVGQTNEVNSHG